MMKIQMCTLLRLCLSSLQTSGKHPEMWFSQVEAQFILTNVTKDETKFYHIVAMVDQSVICRIADLVSNPPQRDKYKAIKERLISRFAGDMRPTHLLAKMQELAGGLNVNDNLLKMLFLQHMLAHIRPILMICDGTLPKLAETADKMTEMPQTTAVSTVPASPEKKLSDGSNERAAGSTSAEIRRLKTNTAQRRNRSSSRSSKETVLCWYHHKYEKQAQHCKPPCMFYDQ